MEKDGEFSGEIPPIVKVEVIFAPVVNFVLQQNDVPTVREVVLTNNGPTTLSDVMVVIVVSGGLSIPWEVQLVSLNVGETRRIQRVDLRLDPARLANQFERERVELNVTVKASGREVGRWAFPLDVLAFNEWPGLSLLPEILAAFVTPNHPAVDSLLVEVREVLRGSTGDPTLDGYQSKSRGRVLEVVSAIYETMRRRKVAYITPPASFERGGQKVRTADQVLESKSGTCLDLSVVLASAIEACGLHPLLLLVHGHAFVGAWLVEEQFAEPTIDDSARVLNRVGLDEVVVIEATAMCDSRDVPFTAAKLMAVDRLERPDEFCMLIDVYASRKSGVRPMPPRVRDGAGFVMVHPVAVETPPLAPRPPEVQVEVPRRVSKSQRPPPAGLPAEALSRLEAWKRRLLDLTLRNPLVNLRPTRKTLPLMVPDVGSLEDAIARGRGFGLAPRSGIFNPQSPRDTKLERNRTGRDIPKELLQADFDANLLRVDVPEEEFDRRAVQLYRAARSAIEESGTNTLFLALGSLVWYETTTTPDRRSAPLLLIPVRIERPQAGRYRLVGLDEETRINVTLLEKLSHDYGMDTGSLATLIEDEAGTDVRAVFDGFRRLVKDTPRWEVRETAQLGLFSFAKFMLWSDLDQRIDQICANPVVRHLLTRGSQPLPPPLFLDETTLDLTRDPEAALCPLDADSSQLAAIESAIGGATFVLQGPPGTGKSQTITNLISRVVAAGKRVLFVAEKMAALSVVQRRLSQAGLGAFVLELHSSKAGKREVLEQIGAALESPAPDSKAAHGWDIEVSRLYGVRDALNAYVNSMHRPLPSGEAPHDVAGRLARLIDVPEVRIDLNNPAQFSAAQLQELRSLAGELGDAAASCGDLPSHPLRGVELTQWELGLEGRVRNSVALLRAAIQQLMSSFVGMGALLGVEVDNMTLREVLSLRSLADHLRSQPSLPAALLVEENIASATANLLAVTDVGDRVNATRDDLLSRNTESCLVSLADKELSGLAAALRAWSELFVNSMSMRIRIEMLTPIGIAAAGGLCEVLLGSPAGGGKLLVALDWSRSRGLLVEAGDLAARAEKLRADLSCRHSSEFFQRDNNRLYDLLTRAVEGFFRALGLPGHQVPRASELSVAEIWFCAQLAKAFAAAPVGAAVLLDSEDSEGRSHRVRDAIDAARRAKATAAELRPRWRNMLRGCDLVAARKALESARDANFLNSWLRRRRLNKLLGHHVAGGELPSDDRLEADLGLAAVLANDDATIARHGQELSQIFGDAWAGAASDTEALNRSLEWALRVRKFVGKAPAETRIDSLALISAASESLDPAKGRESGDGIRLAMTELVSAADTAGRTVGAVLPETKLLSDLALSIELAETLHKLEANAVKLRAVGIDASEYVSTPELRSSLLATCSWADEVRARCVEFAAHAGMGDAPLAWAAWAADGLAVLSSPARKGFAALFEDVRREAKLVLPKVPGWGFGEGALLLQDAAAAATYRTDTDSIARVEPECRRLLGAMWSLSPTGRTAIRKAAAWLQQLDTQITEFSFIDDGSYDVRRRIAGAQCAGEWKVMEGGLLEFVAAADIVVDRLRECASAVQNDIDSTGFVDSLTPPNAAAMLTRWESGLSALPEWCRWRRARANVWNTPLRPLAEASEKGELAGTRTRDAFEVSFGRAWLRQVMASETALREFTRDGHERKLTEFAELDSAIMGRARSVLSGRLSSTVPRQQSFSISGRSEISVLKRELGKQRRHLSVRRLVKELPTLLPLLKPVWLMGPLSVAQYLDPSVPPFDLVIFDEASQIPVWDAVGALARGTQAVIVGDSKQLPPTAFFQKQDDADASTEEADVEEVESILDECKAAGLPDRALAWHYRSRHESLIAFSNRHYYSDRLLTFPSARDAVAGLGVSLRYMAEGQYDRSATRTNPNEARAVAEEVVRRLKAEPNRSIGVVTFSQTQQSAVEDLLDESRRQHPELEPFFAADHPEPVFIKNLENVQGDERDVILFSICYGPDRDGNISMNFGPLNRSGGERRLNVAVTRAREEIIVFSSVRSDDIDLARSRSTGVEHLRSFLDYSARGTQVLAETRSNDSEPARVDDSALAQSIADALRGRGWLVDREIGCSDYRIDLAVRDHRDAGRYLLGIELDGRYYRDAKTARDRDRLRHHVLQGLGWRLHRVWATDYLRDSDGVIARIEKVLGSASEPAPIPTASAVTHEPGSRSSHLQPTLFEGAATTTAPKTAPRMPEGAIPYHYHQFRGPPRNPYSFHEANADLRVADDLAQIVSIEGPVHSEQAFSALAQAWGIQRVTARVLDRLDEVCARHPKIVRRGDFLWAVNSSPELLNKFRTPSPDDEPRPLERIAPEELAIAALSVLREHLGMPVEELCRSVVEILGLKRVTAAGRIAVEHAISLLEARRHCIRSGETVRLKR